MTARPGNAGSPLYWDTHPVDKFMINLRELNPIYRPLAELSERFYQFWIILRLTFLKIRKPHVRRPFSVIRKTIGNEPNKYHQRTPIHHPPVQSLYIFPTDLLRVLVPSLAIMEQAHSWSVADEKGIRRPPHLRGVALLALSFQTLGTLSLCPITVGILMAL